MLEKSQTNQKNFLFLNSFILKLVALFTMTLDHIGAAMQVFTPWNVTTITVLRTIGRLALPLFAFMIVEGIIHTKNTKKYFLRLGVLALLISAALCVFEYSNNPDLFQLSKEGNIFLDLILGAFGVWSLKQNRKPLKLLAILPLAISIVSFVVVALEFNSHYVITWYPMFLRLQYGWYSVGLIYGFYVAKLLAPLFLESFYHVEKGSLTETTTQKVAENLFGIFFLVAMSMIYYSVFFINASYVYWDYKTQNYAMFAGLLILFYNHKPGFHKKWFQIGTYLYYPVHILVIILVFALIYGY